MSGVYVCFGVFVYLFIFFSFFLFLFFIFFFILLTVLAKHLQWTIAVLFIEMYLTINKNVLRFSIFFFFFYYYHNFSSGFD